MLTGSEIQPIPISALFSTPLYPKIPIARESMITQPIKFGKVVTVCTTFLNLFDFISLSNTANSIGNGENTYPSR